MQVCVLIDSWMPWYPRVQGSRTFHHETTIVDISGSIDVKVWCKLIKTVDHNSTVDLKTLSVQLHVPCHSGSPLDAMTWCLWLCEETASRWEGVSTSLCMKMFEVLCKAWHSLKIEHH